jgi:hypothetical protein
MTQRPRLIETGLWLALLVLLPTGPLCAEDPKPPAPPGAPAAGPEMPPHVVARILGPGGEVLVELTFENLRPVLVLHVLGDLDEITSSPSTILRELIEELLVEQEARALGIVLAEEEIKAYIGKLDSQLRVASGGQQNIGEVRKSKGMTFARFHDSIRILILKERIAGHAKWLGKLPENDRQRMSQVAVVMTELHKRARIVWHANVAPMLLQQAKQAAPVPGPGDALVTVNDQPIGRQEFGAGLLDRLSEDVLKDVVDKECATKLLSLETVALDDQAMEEELALRERNWLVQRTLQSQTEWHKVGFDEFLKATLKKTRAEVKADRYYRSFYGLVRRERAKVTEEALQKEWELKKTTQYGASILVEALQVGFERKNALLTGGGGRDRAQALAIAQTVLSQVARGQSFGDVTRDVVARSKNPRTGIPDSTLRASERRLYNTQADQLLYNEAIKLKDGEMTAAPLETLSEVHLLRRKALEPGPSYATVKDVLRETLAGRAAQQFMQDQAKDPTRVRVRWPIRIP